MRTTRLLCLAAALCAAVTVAADDRVTREIARLESALAAAEKADLPKDVHELFAVHRDALARAKKAGSPEYQLYRLRDPFTGIETLAFLTKHKAGSVAEFQKLWEANRVRFAAKPPQARGTLVERALIESATTRADRLYRASLPYAKASAPWSGVYYLGEAEANLRFREFVLSIAHDSTEKSPSRERVAALLDDLNAITLKHFAADVTNQQLVPVSVRIKEARELLDANRVDGAALLAVEARAALSRRGGPRGTYPTHLAAPPASLDALLRAWSSDEDAPMSAALRDEVLPFYATLYTTARAQNAKRPAQVTVTLVRWPYT